MTVDYDGVIIGGTIQARQVVATAAREGARVALVEPPGQVESQIRRQLTVQVLAQTSGARQQRREVGQLDPAAPEDWSRLQQQVIDAVDIAYPHLGLDTLAISGVDVVAEPGQFSPKPRLTFTTASRRLRGRRYLLSPPTRVTVPAIPGLATVPALTPETLLDLTHPPQELAILGRSPDAIALAQALAILGTQVTLVTRGDRLLPGEGNDISVFVESLLMASGVNLRLGAKLASVHHTSRFSIQLMDGDRLKVQHLLLATARHPQLTALNLHRIGVQTNPTHIPVDDQLKTTRSHCFAFGPCLGGYWANHTDQQDGQIALHNALYLPWRRLQYLYRIGLMATTPDFARFGMTAQQALTAYGSDARVIQVPYGQIIKAHLEARITGFCRCMIHRDGTILGAQLVGPRASDLAQTLALLVHRRTSMHHLAKMPYLSMTYTDLLHRITEAWQQAQWQPGTWRRDWAENWFNWRRSSHRN